MIQLLIFIAIIAVSAFLINQFTNDTPVELLEENEFEKIMNRLYKSRVVNKASPIFAGRISRNKKSNKKRVSKDTKSKHKK